MEENETDWFVSFVVKCFSKIVALEVPGGKRSLVMKTIAQQIIFKTGKIRIL